MQNGHLSIFSRIPQLLLALLLVQVNGLAQSADRENGAGLPAGAVVARYAQQYLADSRTHSVSIALFLRGEEMTFHYGEQHPGQNDPPTDSTLYEMASVTKTFTGTMAAKAVLEGKISLEDDLRKYLPGDYPNLAYEGQALTIRHILTHSSGFPNFPPNADSKAQFLEGLHEIEIPIAPGLEFRYSNTAPEVLAYALEQVYGMPYQELIRQHLLEPNGMDDTHFALDAKAQERLVLGYNGVGEAKEHYQNNLWGGIAGLHSNVRDLLQYIRYHLDENIPEVRESHRNFFRTQYDFDIGYHWNIDSSEEYPIYRHHGGIWGMQNWLMVFPQDQIGIAVLSNASFPESEAGKGTDELLYDLAMGIIEQLR